MGETDRGERPRRQFRSREDDKDIEGPRTELTKLLLSHEVEVCSGPKLRPGAVRTSTPLMSIKHTLLRRTYSVPMSERVFSSSPIIPRTLSDSGLSHSTFTTAINIIFIPVVLLETTG